MLLVVLKIISYSLIDSIISYEKLGLYNIPLSYCLNYSVMSQIGF